MIKIPTKSIAASHLERVRAQKAAGQKNWDKGPRTTRALQELSKGKPHKGSAKVKGSLYGKGKGKAAAIGGLFK